MSLISPENLRIAVLILLVNVHQIWHRAITTIVPDFYLDEVFHVPQAQAYWAGKWTHWDDKITTPPALYVFSYMFNFARRLGWRPELTVEDLRKVNTILLYFMLLALSIWISISRKTTDPHSVLQLEYVIIAFPLFFFFSGLYYTDVFSALTVVLTYISWTASVRRDKYRLAYQISHVVFGLVSLASRQTNVFWVGVFLAALQVVETTKREVSPAQLHDPRIHQIWFEDTPKTCISLIQAVFPIIPRLILDTWPSLSLIASFVAFVIWNGGVVLGDKSNHIATIHVPQMLYIWPFIVFFSWPVLIPQLLNPSRLQRQTPRLWVVISTLVMMGLAVHFNTIVHPFTLADNRHYTFYVFRILRRHWLIKYMAVPIYAICAWLVISTLADPTPKPTPPSLKTTKSTKPHNNNQPKSTKITTTLNPTPVPETTTPTPTDSNTLTFLLIWLATTTLSLISAPLVEPRYFIIPWLLWRLHVPTYIHPDTVITTSSSSSSSSSRNLPHILNLLPRRTLTIELAWYMAINAVTCYIFLYRGFSWPQEPGMVQRFMW